MFPLLISTSLHPHVVESDELAQVILGDLQSRYTEDIKIANFKMENLNLDFGGSIMSRWDMMSISKVRFWPHQIEQLLVEINRSLQDVREFNGVRFCKIWAHQMIVCLSLETVISIKRGVLQQLDSLREHAKKNLSDWTEAMRDIQDHPNLSIQNEIEDLKH